MSGTILRSEALTRPWAGTDPFLFCAHHLDRYPAADAGQGVPQGKLAGGRPLGDDFSGQDGYSMYYGTSVPGFPAHPHRGFETVTVVPTGLVDHADSLGATARYGDGDVQWLTAGAGVMHSEMFPLRDTNAGNLLDLFQIWLNLPARNKMADPAFVMLWDGTIPRYRTLAENGAAAEVKIVAGVYAPQEGGGAILTPPKPAPNSYAGDPDGDVAIWLVTLQPGARITLPPAARAGARRTFYFHAGDALQVAGQPQPGQRLIEARAQDALELVNTGTTEAKLLMLQGVPIGEPVAAMGPFVMNTRAEIDQARRDFARTQFGGWPWPASGPVHPARQGRFAKHPGRAEIELPVG